MSDTALMDPHRLLGRLAVTALIATLVTIAGGQNAAHAEDKVAGNAAAYRSALSALSVAPGGGPHTLTLTSDINLGVATIPEYSGSAELLIDGDGHTVNAMGNTIGLSNSGGAQVTLKDITFTNGLATAFGGAVNSTGTVVLDKATFTDNTAPEGGGAIFGTLVTGTGTFTGNEVTGLPVATPFEGGAIEATTVDLDGGSFDQNTATAAVAFGGAIEAASVTLNGTTFTDNSATTGGGAVNATTSFDSTDAVFTTNTSVAGTGGAVRGPDIHTVRGLFDRNSAGAGGAMRTVSNGTVMTENTDFTGNTAPQGAGGGILAADVTIEGGSFTLNTARNGGAASDADGTPRSVEVTGATFTDNRATGGTTAQGRGGALRFRDITVTDSVFTSNDADHDGGAIDLAWTNPTPSEATITGTTFIGNRAERGGAVFGATSGLPVLSTTVNLHNSTLTANTGTTAGGGAHAYNINASHSTIVGNSSPLGANVVVDSLFEADRTVVGEPANGSDCYFTTLPGGGGFSNGHSLDSDGTCGFNDATDPPPGSPVVGPLRDNGGPTATMYPLAGSPLVDAIPAGSCSATLSTDQRGVERYPAGGACDIGAIEQTYPGHKFTDVPPWVEDAVRWMTSEVNDPPLMTGFNDDTFRPNDNITRGQVIRQLYRLAGAPDPGAYPPHGFTDVPPWLEDSVRWAKGESIATGITATTFVPDDPITRAQVVRMEYRLAGSPAVGALPAHPFGDVPPWVENAVRWAANTDNPLPLVTGITPTTFEPNSNITRAQVVRMTYRLAITPAAWLNAGTAPATVPFRPSP